MTSAVSYVATRIVNTVVATTTSSQRQARGCQRSTAAYACAVASALSVASVVVALAGTRAGENPTHSRDFVYYVVSLDPWPFYLALAGIVAVVAALGPWLDGPARLVVLALGFLALVVALAGLEPSTFSAFRARGGGIVAAFGLQFFLFWRWIRSRGAAEPQLEPTHNAISRFARALVVVPLVFVAAMLAANVRPLGDWSRSLDAFRTGVDETPGVAQAIEVVPERRRGVLWGWTGSSLSLIVRERPDAGVLVDRNPSLVPFPPSAARAQLPDRFEWRS